MSLSSLDSTVDVLRELERDDLANALADEYFTQCNAEEDMTVLKRLKSFAFSGDLKDKYLLSQLRNICTTKVIDKRSLADILKANMFQEICDWEDVIHMDSFETEDYYNFFKTEKSNILYLYVRKCLDIGKFRDENGIRDSVSEKAKNALLKLASESRINRIRVSRLYEIDVTQVPQP